MEDNSQEQDFSKLSIEDRVTHKNWKARVSGYEELAKLFPQFTEEKEFQKYAPLVKKFVVDTNAAAQEKGLAATLAFVDYSPQAGKYVEHIVAGVATKCLTSNRAKTKELANDVVMMCIEIERQDVVVEELVKALEQKTPKNVAATISMIKRCLNQFGYKVVSLKPIVPTLARLLEERDPAVREETKQLTIEIYRWIKDALMPQLNNLKPILLQELQVEFDKHKDSKATPERLLRSQQQRQQVDEESNENGANVDDVDGDAAVDEEIDPFELMEPVDILSKLPGDFYTLLEAKKWTDRRDTLEKLFQLLEQNPKLATGGDYAELVKQLKKIIAKDSNIVVATLAIKSLTLLASGLRKNFHNHANSSVPVLLEKFKEKKANVVQSLRDAIDAVYLSTTLENIQEDIVGSLDNKNPSIRSETALFLARSFAKTNPNLINKKLLKTLTTSLLKTLSDSDAIVRESSAEALGTALKAQGERNMAPFLQGLEALKTAKIEEYRAKVEVKKFPQSAPPPVVPATNSSSKPKTAPARKPVSKPKPAVSTESLDENFLPPPPTASNGTIKVNKPKVVAKSRLGINSDSSNKPPAIRGGGSKIGVGRATSTLTKGSSNQQSSSNIAGGSSSNLLSSGQSSAKKQDQEQSGPLLNGNLKLKEQRFADERALKVLKWNFTAPREEFYQLLREQMTTAEWQPQLITNCYHSDFKYHIKAIDQLRDYFQRTSEDNPTVVANLDLVLKWIALRFFDTNPSVITKCLELLLVMFRLCEETHQYQLNDIEANSFIPYLVQKFGDPKDAVRNKVHDILARMRNIYPANKIFAFLFNALQSKNARQRATCLEEISQLIELKGMAIFQPPNSLQLIKDVAKFIAERDNAVRNGALACIVQVYFLEGERMFKLIGSLSDKEMSLVEERIKRASKNRPPPTQQPIKQQQMEKHLPDLSSSNNGSQSSLPTLAGSNSRLHQIGGSGRGLPVPNEYQQSDSPAFGFGKQSSTLGISCTNSPQYDIGATYSKSRSASSLLKSRHLTSTTSSPSLRAHNGLLTAAVQQQSSPLATANDDHNDPKSRTVYHHPDNDEQPSQQSDSDLYSTTSSNTDQYALLDQKVKQALNLPELKMVRRYQRSTSNQSTTSTSSDDGGNKHLPVSRRSGGTFRPLNPELNQRFTVMFAKLSSTELPVATEALEYLNQVLKDYERYQPYLEPKIDQLIIFCNKQYRLLLSKHFPESSTNGSIENGNSPNVSGTENSPAQLLFRLNSALLTKIFKCPLGKRVSRDTLRELFTHLLSYFNEIRDNQLVFNGINFVITVILTGADATNLMSALIRMLHDYVDKSTTDENSGRYLEITMKFLWRVTKGLEKYMDELNIDQVLYESHLFFKSYPRNWWKINNRNDIPLRTIKTLIYYIVDLKGDAILNNFSLIKNKDESELSYYVQKALRQCDKSASADISSSSTKTNGSTCTSSSNISQERTPLKQTTVSNIPRTSLQDFPLPLVQVKTESGEMAQIPVIRTNDDFRVYADYTAKQLNIPDWNYERFHQKNQQLRPEKGIKNVEEAKRAVEEARQRLNHFKRFCQDAQKNNGNISSTTNGLGNLEPDCSNSKNI